MFFLLVLTEIIPQLCLFSCNCPCRSAENKEKQVIEHKFSIFIRRLGDDSTFNALSDTENRIENSLICLWPYSLTTCLRYAIDLRTMKKKYGVSAKICGCFEFCAVTRTMSNFALNFRNKHEI